MFRWVTYWQRVVGGQAVQGSLSCPPPRISERIDNTQILLHHLLQEYLVERNVNFISVNQRCLLQTFSLVTYWQRVGGKLSRAVYLAPPPRILERMDIPQILLHHLLQEYLVERDINFTEMLTSNVQLGCVLTRGGGGGGQAVQGGLSCPPPRISQRMDNSQILLQHLLQEYLVERDINFTEMLTTNVQMGCVLTRGGGQAVQGGLSCPLPRISERKDNQQILLHQILQEYLVERDINFISVNLRCLPQICSVGLRIDKGWGASCPGQFILPPPPPRISERMDNPQILLHQLLQEYLVERDINFILVNLRCLLQMFSWFILPPAQNFRENG